MRALAALTALLLCAGADAHEIERICRSAVGAEVPTGAEYQRDPKAHADNFCALLLYNQAAVIGQLGKVLKTNRAWANPNRYYFNPKFRPDVDYVQLLRPWMQRDGWKVYRGGAREHSWYGYYPGFSYRSGAVADAYICPPPEDESRCIEVLLVRFASTTGVPEHAVGAWGVSMEHWDIGDLITNLTSTNASTVKCVVEDVLDAYESTRERAALEDVADGCDGIDRLRPPGNPLGVKQRVEYFLD